MFYNILLCFKIFIPNKRHQFVLIIGKIAQILKYTYYVSNIHVNLKVARIKQEEKVPV